MRQGHRLGDHRAERRKLGGQILGQHLEDWLGPDEVFELVDTEIAQCHAGRQLIPDQLVGGGTEQDLPAVAGGHQPRDAVEQRAGVDTLLFLRHAGMQRHPHAQRTGRAPGFGM
jgi:hypothetical protein